MVDESPRTTDFSEKKLTPKQRLFVESYASNGFNATKAAIAAGYSEATAYSQGSRLLKDVEIKAALDQFFQENTMRALEVLSRLSDHARGDIGDIWDESTGQVDWGKARAMGKTALIKRIKHKTSRVTRDDGTDVETFEDEIELHNPQTALQLLGKQHGLFVERNETTLKGSLDIKTYEKVSPDDWNDSDS